MGLMDFLKLKRYQNMDSGELCIKFNLDDNFLLNTDFSRITEKLVEKNIINKISKTQKTDLEFFLYKRKMNLENTFEPKNLLEFLLKYKNSDNLFELMEIVLSQIPMNKNYYYETIIPYFNQIYINNDVPLYSNFINEYFYNQKENENENYNIKQQKLNKLLNSIFEKNTLDLNVLNKLFYKIKNSDEFALINPDIKLKLKNDFEYLIYELREFNQNIKNINNSMSIFYNQKLNRKYTEEDDLMLSFMFPDLAPFLNPASPMAWLIYSIHQNQVLYYEYGDYSISYNKVLNRYDIDEGQNNVGSVYIENDELKINDNINNYTSIIDTNNWEIKEIKGDNLNNHNSYKFEENNITNNGNFILEDNSLKRDYDYPNKEIEPENTMGKMENFKDNSIEIEQNYSSSFTQY